MSVYATAWAKQQTAGSTMAKIVLLILADYADEDGSCFPSQTTIADEAEMSRRSVQRQLDVLAEKELVAVVPRFIPSSDGKSRQTSNRYLLAMPPGQSVHPPAPDGRAPLDTRGARTTKEPSTNPGAAQSELMERNRRRREGQPACEKCADAGVWIDDEGAHQCECVA